MAIIRFTDADRMASIVVPTEWYRAEVTEIDGPKESQSKSSFNFFTKFQIIDGPYAGKELGVVFNTKTKSPSVLGSQQFLPSAWMLPLAAAVNNVSREEVKEIDTEKILRKPFDLKVEKGIIEGVPMNTILAFLPDGAGKNEAPTF